MQTTKVILLRHGECEGGNILRGQIDVALTEQGKKQMQTALSPLFSNEFSNEFSGTLSDESPDDCLPDIVMSSPLIRCAKVAQQFAEKHQLGFVIEDRFKELNFGDWDGKTFDTLYQCYAAELDAYWANPWKIPPPNGESMQAFEYRIGDAWQSMLEAHQGQCVLLVTHGGVIRHLIAKALGVSQAGGFYTSLKLPYAAKVEIDVLHDSDKQYMTLNWG
ncbi:alpha-ribazole phosphatase family protein [Shewanella schlegeliana]|uniref:Alpha-ribazole phosphatase family protein n=2 Tax=Shewanella schlegeliana TaxID=190308 RepID=A0ABS1SVQ1_9GAMM|nr:alpha-ribazole phosphatase family protein [Shewanella schlegeliana]MBL4912613.1 alpha-ribazole phosphatase family protein [Shewanella schlegeliana]MCL1109879.1 alpha-ribazole phosphatase family protein [Shewanella schlegeliana]